MNGMVYLKLSLVCHHQLFALQKPTLLCMACRIYHTGELRRCPGSLESFESIAGQPAAHDAIQLSQKAEMTGSLYSCRGANQCKLLEGFNQSQIMISDGQLNLFTC